MLYRYGEGLAALDAGGEGIGIIEAFSLLRRIAGSLILFFRSLFRI
jgi:hypothetical protein